MSTVALVSFRLGGADGVSVVSEHWKWALGELGWSVRTVAGRGPVDVVVPGLAWPPGVDATTGPVAADEVAAALDGCDVTVVENLCSLPLNLSASAAVADTLRGRPAVLHHHDLPWQNQRHLHLDWSPPNDPAWANVVTTELSRRQLAERGVAATVEPPRIDLLWTATGRRDATRTSLGVEDGELLLLQPTRAVPNKGVVDGLSLAAKANATYWLTGPAEDGFDAELDAILNYAPTRVLRGADERGLTMADAYAAADAVVLPSWWEGFGLPILEAAAARRPLAVRRYPVAAALEAEHGFAWLPIDDPARLQRSMVEPEQAALDHNEAIVRDHFNVRQLPGRLAAILETIR